MSRAWDQVSGTPGDTETWKWCSVRLSDNLEIQTLDKLDMQSGDHCIMLNYALYWRASGTGFLICDIFFYLMILRFSD